MLLVWARPLLIKKIMQNYKEEAKKQRQLIQALERERDRYGKDAAEAQQSCISQVSSLRSVYMSLLQDSSVYNVCCT